MMLCFFNDCSYTLLLALTLTHSLFVERERGERGEGGEGERGREGERERERERERGGRERG